MKLQFTLTGYHVV